MIIATLQSMGSALWKAAPGVGGGDGEWWWVWRSESRHSPSFSISFPFFDDLEVRQLLERARSTENQAVSRMETARKGGLLGSDVTLSTSWDVEC